MQVDTDQSVLSRNLASRLSKAGRISSANSTGLLPTLDNIERKYDSPRCYAPHFTHDKDVNNPQQSLQLNFVGWPRLVWGEQNRTGSSEPTTEESKQWRELLLWACF